VTPPPSAPYHHEARAWRTGVTLIAGLDELGATVVTPRNPARRGPLVCVRSIDVEALVTALAGERIVVSMRDANVRIALHLYNVEEDVDTLLAALARHRRLLA